MSDLGQFALVLGLFLCSYAVVVDLLGSWRKDEGFIKSARNATVASFGCLSVAMLVLWVLLVQSDFSVKYVADHTSKALPLAYKLSALWAGAAGSLLLWLRSTSEKQNPESKPRVLIIGGGFGGLACATGLATAQVEITLADRHNYHLFQPLLYQVATAVLSPADIAAPIRRLLRNQANARVVLAKLTGVDLQKKLAHFPRGDVAALAASSQA